MNSTRLLQISQGRLFRRGRSTEMEKGTHPPTAAQTAQHQSKGGNGQMAGATPEGQHLTVETQHTISPTHSPTSQPNRASEPDIFPYGNTKLTLRGRHSGRLNVRHSLVSLCTAFIACCSRLLRRVPFTTASSSTRLIKQSLEPKWLRNNCMLSESVQGLARADCPRQ